MIQFIDYLTQVATSLLAFVGACAALSAAIPKPLTDGLLSKLHTLINVCGCNIKHARNEK